MSTLRFIAFKIKSALTAKREIISLDVDDVYRERDFIISQVLFIDEIPCGKQVLKSAWNIREIRI